jgi:hypothetical protein
MTNKEKLIVKIEEAIIEYIDLKHQDSYQKQYLEMFQKELPAEYKDSKLSRELQKVNNFASDLLSKIGRKVYEDNKTAVYDALHKEMGSLLDELFTNEESNELYEFISTNTGRKLLRNLDLFRDAYLLSTKILVSMTIQAWGDPRIADLINDFIDELEDEPESD